MRGGESDGRLADEKLIEWDREIKFSPVSLATHLGEERAMSGRYALERDMTPAVEAWLRSHGMVVRREVWMPTGVCDLVGCRLGAENLQRRLATGYRARSSGQSQRDLEKGQPWLPLHERLVFVELKLARRGEVWRQAMRFRAYGEVWVAMPYPASEYRPLDEERYASVGVLRVDGGVTVERLAAGNVVTRNCQVLRVVDSMAAKGCCPECGNALVGEDIGKDRCTACEDHLADIIDFEQDRWVDNRPQGEGTA